MSKRLHRISERFTLDNLTLFLTAATGIVTLFSRVFHSNLGLMTPESLARGEYWQILFFPFRLDVGIIGLIFILLIFWQFGTELEAIMGKVRYNLYIFLGIFFVILGAILFPGLVYAHYFYFSVFFAMAYKNPHTEILILFFPVKLGVAALLITGLALYSIISLFLATGNFLVFFGPLFGLGNFLIFFGREFLTGKRRGVKATLRKREFKVVTPESMHSCAVCGRTEVSDPALEFRYCEECEGDREYCMDHLKNHEHI